MAEMFVELRLADEATMLMSINARQIMKEPWKAFVLSFVLPGAGLAYLGKWSWAVVNFCIATVVLMVVMFVQSETAFDYLHYLILIIAAGSGGWAHACAVRLKASD